MKAPSQFKSYTPEELEELNSNFIIDKWSYSKVMQFARNEKAFEMYYIYNHRAKSSATTVAGQAYHYALQWYFQELKEGVELDLPQLEIFAFNHIDEQPANDWKVQKTTPTIEECQQKALKTANALLTNFYNEKSVYTDAIDGIIEVENYFTEYITVDGVDIPMPVALKIDLVAKTKDGKLVIIDHKSKTTYTSEEEIALSIGKQAIVYTLAYEAKTGNKVDEVWFAENKASKNKNGEPQIQIFKVALDDNTRRLYEALLYEPLKRMLSATADPDYVYLINDSDNFVDKAEMYDFWTKTLIAEVEDFDIPETKKEMVSKRLKKIRDTSLSNINPKVIKNFRNNAKQFIKYDLSNTNMTQEEKIQHILRTFGIIVEVAHTLEGYSSNTYLLEVSAGTKISAIKSHKLDIANALDVVNVRIPHDLMIYENRSFLAIETSKKRDKDLLWDKKELKGMRIPIGKDNIGNTIIWDLANHSTPHALICGATGSGKSVSLISTIEYAKLIPDIEKIIILDPKYEFVKYNHYKKIEVYNDIMDIETKMKELVDEMNYRVNNGISSYTLIIIDEFADALSASRKGKSLGDDKSLEENLRILLQKGRSSGFRIASATQRASTKVITGDAKVNYPVQICFRVPKEVDSRVVIDEAGAESLAGGGDFLMNSPEYLGIVRGQAFYKK